jgi:DNA-directed RNA polymerase specialized sigma subunit
MKIALSNKNSTLPLFQFLSEKLEERISFDMKDNFAIFEAIKRSENEEEKQRLKEIAILGNDPLVFMRASVYGNNLFYHDREDLIQEGRIGLQIAVEKYDVDRRVRENGIEKRVAFSTCAVFWINQKMKRYFEGSGIIKKPVSIKRMLSEYKKVVDRLAIETGETPAISEIANQMGVPISRIRDIQKFGEDNVHSLDRPVYEYDLEGDEKSNLEVCPDRKKE